MPPSYTFVMTGPNNKNTALFDGIYCTANSKVFFPPFVASVHIYVWLQGRSLSSASPRRGNAPDLLPGIPGGPVPEGSIWEPQPDGKRSCPALLLKPCRSHTGSRAEPGGDTRRTSHLGTKCKQRSGTIDHVTLYCGRVICPFW